MYRRWKPWHRQPRHGNRYAGFDGPPAAVVCQVTEPPPRHREHLSHRILNPIPADPSQAIPVHSPISDCGDDSPLVMDSAQVAEMLGYSNITSPRAVFTVETVQQPLSLRSVACG